VAGTTQINDIGRARAYSANQLEEKKNPLANGTGPGYTAMGQTPCRV